MQDETPGLPGRRSIQVLLNEGYAFNMGIILVVAGGFSRAIWP